MNYPEMLNNVKLHLANASESYLQQIVAHGIHNITNAFCGENEEEYELYYGLLEEEALKMLLGMK